MAFWKYSEKYIFIVYALFLTFKYKYEYFGILDSHMSFTFIIKFLLTITEKN